MRRGSSSTSPRRDLVVGWQRRVKGSQMAGSPGYVGEVCQRLHCALTVPVPQRAGVWSLGKPRDYVTAISRVHLLATSSVRRPSPIRSNSN